MCCEELLGDMCGEVRSALRVSLGKGALPVGAVAIVWGALVELLLALGRPLLVIGNHDVVPLLFRGSCIAAYGSSIYTASNCR